MRAFACLYCSMLQQIRPGTETGSIGQHGQERTHHQAWPLHAKVHARDCSAFGDQILPEAEEEISQYCQEAGKESGNRDLFLTMDEILDVTLMMEPGEIDQDSSLKDFPLLRQYCVYLTNGSPVV